MHISFPCSNQFNLKSQCSSALNICICLVLPLFFLSCAEGMFGSSTEENTGTFAKADVSSGPIEKLSCQIEESFVRKGSFARIKVDALDAEGIPSRNYELKPTPDVGTRIIQRNQIIFDLDGAYTVQCCALDSNVCDQVAVQVGELAPALAVSVQPFVEDGSSLRGHAVDSHGMAAKVTVNGYPVNSDEHGHFETRIATPSGLNHYEVIATGNDGTQSIRHAWAIGGPFYNVDEMDPSALRLRLGLNSYPLISRVLTDYFIQLADRTSNSAELSVTQSGSALGYNWEITPTRLGLGSTEVRLAEGSRADELILLVHLDDFQAFAQGRTRFRGGFWKDREVVVTADLYIEVPFILHTDGVQLGQVKSEVNRLDVEISDMPGFIEGILEFIFDGTIQRKLVEMIESVGDQGLSDVLTRFEFNEQLELPEPLTGELELTGRVSELQVDPQGLTLGIGLAVDGETDPARLHAPGPLMMNPDLPKLNLGSSYELALHIDALNRILFSAWQSGSLDIATIKDQPFGETDDLLGDQSLTLFITPSLPPVARMGDRLGEIMIEFGALRVDGILNSDLGVLNCAIDVGASIRTLLSSREDLIQSSTAAENIKADILIAPAGWEREPTRALVERIIETDIAPNYAEILKRIPVPQADLSSLDLNSINALITRSLNVSTTSNSLTISAQLELK